MSIADIGKEAAEASSTDTDDEPDADYDEYERADVSDAEFIKMHPGPTAIEVTVEGLRYFPPAPDGQGEYDDSDRGYAGLILTDPEVPDDEIAESVGIFQSTTDTGDDYKVVNVNDDSVDVYDAGVSVGQMFESDRADAFDVEQGVLNLGTNAGISVVRTLDVCGLENADVVRTEDGDPEIQENGWPTTNNGLIEEHPRNNTDDDFYEAPRYFRDPQLRPDVEGQRVIVLLQHMSNVIEDYEGNAHWATVLAQLDDERTEELAQEYADDDYTNGDDPDDFIWEVSGEQYIQLAPTTEFEPDDALQYETEWMEWNWPSDERVEELADEQGVQR